MLPDLSDSALRKHRDNEEIIKQTANQIIKDFALFGFEISFPSNMKMAYFELFDQLLHHIVQMWDNNNNILVSLLYRIDLSESLIWQKKDEFPDVPVTEILTELIIDRELKKVLTRKYFSQSDSSDQDAISS